MDRPSQAPLTLFLSATLALVVSALLLLAGLAVYVEYGYDRGAAKATPLVIPGRKLQVVFGSGQVAGDALAITAYHPDKDKLIAIAVRRGEFLADDFPLLRYDLDTGLSGPKMELIWRLASDPISVKSLVLNDTDGAAQWMNLAQHPDWHGSVVEIGIYVTASDEREHVSIGSLTLEPGSWWGVLSSHWADWTAYRGWSVRSINLLYGSVDSNAWSPVVVAALWSVLALALLLALRLLLGVVHRGVWLAVVLLPWISLDLLWQYELDKQLLRTQDQFAGKSVHEKHLADIDAPVYSYVQRLKQQVLPAEAARIVILHNSRGHDFDRLKAQYYLLPHNVYNFGRVPPDGSMQGVDFILVLGDVPDIQFRQADNALVWKRGKKSLSVERVDSDAMGNLYRIKPVTPGQEGG